MNFDASKIDAALSDKALLSRDLVVSWIESTPDSDLLTLSKLYRLTDEGYYRIQPELGMEKTCVFICRYLLACVRYNVENKRGIASRYEATETLHVWFRHLAEKEGTSGVLKQASDAITSTF